MEHISKQSILVPIFCQFVLQWHLFSMSHLFGHYLKHLSARSMTSSWNSGWFGFPSQVHHHGISAKHLPHVALVALEKPKADPES